MKFSELYNIDIATNIRFEYFSKKADLNLSNLKYGPNYEEYEKGFHVKQNPNIISIKIDTDASKNNEFLFHKENAYKLYKAVTRNTVVSENIFNNACKDNGLLNVLNANISRFIIMTKRELVEGTDLTKILLTTLNRDGTLKANEISEAFCDNVDFDESYHYDEEDEK